MSKADHDQHRRDIDGINTDMALLDEDLNSRVDTLRNTVDSDRIDVIARIDALESTINTRFDDINDLGENTDHEVELLKARVSALESATGADPGDTYLRFAKLEERQRETAEYVNAWVGEYLVRQGALESKEDVIQNQDAFKIGDRVTILDEKTGEPVDTGVVIALHGDVTDDPYLVQTAPYAEPWWFATDQLRHACQNRTESGTELAGNVGVDAGAYAKALLDISASEARVNAAETGYVRAMKDWDLEIARADTAERELTDLKVACKRASERANENLERALKAEAAIQKAEVLQSRAASEKRIDPARARQCGCGGTYSASGDCGCGRVYGRVVKGPTA